MVEPRIKDPAKRQKSRITVPVKANPFVKLAFSEMARQNVTYSEIEWKSNVLISTIKAWRCENSPGLLSIEAVLGALGWSLVPVPKLDNLPKDVLEALEEIGQHFRSDEETFGAALLAAATWPAYAKKRQAITLTSVHAG
jgi:hypothetical protein